MTGLVLGTRLRMERERLGLSQVEVSDALGTRREMWSKYERDVTEPGTSVIMAFCKIGADPSYLLAGVRASGGADANEATILEQYRSIGTHLQKVVREVVAGFSQNQHRKLPEELELAPTLAEDELRLLGFYAKMDEIGKSMLMYAAEGVASGQCKKGD